MAIKALGKILKMTKVPPGGWKKHFFFGLPISGLGGKGVGTKDLLGTGCLTVGRMASRSGLFGRSEVVLATSFCSCCARPLAAKDAKLGFVAFCVS